MAFALQAMHPTRSTPDPRRADPLAPSHAASGAPSPWHSCRCTRTLQRSTRVWRGGRVWSSSWSRPHSRPRRILGGGGYARAGRPSTRISGASLLRAPPACRSGIRLCGLFFAPSALRRLDARTTLRRAVCAAVGLPRHPAIRLELCRVGLPALAGGRIATPRRAVPAAAKQPVRYDVAAVSAGPAQAAAAVQEHVARQLVQMHLWRFGWALCRVG